MKTRICCCGVAAALLAFFVSVAFADSPPVSVAAAQVRPIVEIVRVSGTVTSPQAAVLSPSVGGLVQKMNVDAGDRVRAGDVIVTLDRELEVLALERARAEAAQALATRDDAQRRLDEAVSVGTIRAIAESEIRSLRAQVARTEAALMAVEAAVREQEAIVRRHAVRAPFDGVISRRIAAVGEWVNPGSGLVELVATERLRFDFRVPQRYFAQLDANTDVTIALDAAPDRAVRGRIHAIVPIKDPGARTFLLRAVADTEVEVPITPGMSAQAALHIDAHRSGIVVPRDALLRYTDGRVTVWTVDGSDADAVVHENRVETGVEFDGLIEIRAGLEDGATVVTRGNEALRDGQTVTVR
ncbi:MAG: efflux RND transporter periplasmic adaptor subunit [Gammaproteobacteria bacterium]|nr:efflux RND transporter periplasmic adaptor subunit [Gammaproteobacteria bacterium]